MNLVEPDARVLAIFAVLIGLGGCATSNSDELAREQAVQHSEHRLAQRAHELVRARGDLKHFRTTHRHLREHESAWEPSAFAPFLIRFIEERIDPLVSNDWQSSHPELAQLDVDLRLLRAQTFIDLRRKRDAVKAVREIARNYRGQGQMLVTNSLGERATLKDSLAALDRMLNGK